MTKYPRISNKRKLKKVPVCKCGEIAQWGVIVQVNNFRGDDDYYHACDKHKGDIEFLIEGLGND